MQEVVNKHNFIINRKEFVPVITVEWLEEKIRKLKIERYWDSTSEERAFKVLLEAAHKEALK